MYILNRFILTFLFQLIIATACITQSMATPVLVTNTPWGSTADLTNMNQVFGAGNYSAYSYATANPLSVFNASNSFVWLEGGANTDIAWYNYLNTNQTLITDWVNSGGSLLLMSAGWDSNTYTFGQASLVFNRSYSSTGTLTSDGLSAFTYYPTPATQSGNSLAHDYVIGTNLTVFMTGTNNLPIIAGMELGSGYIMYSGLTDSNWHNSGYNLVNNVVAYTSNQAGQSADTPEPATMLLMGVGVAGGALLRRKMKRSEV